MICHFVGELEPPLTFTRAPLHDAKNRSVIARAQIKRMLYLS
jgi:hypothetical protein